MSDPPAPAAEMKARMLGGELYLAVGDEIAADQARAAELLERYNATRHAEHELRAELLRELLGEVGRDVVIRPPFHCDYGSHIAIGDGTFVNFGCVMLDVAPIRIGAACQIATGVHVVTATHPVDPEGAQAGIVYRTDVARSKKVRVVQAVPLEEGPGISYPIAVVAGRPNEAEARALVDFLASPGAAGTFEEFGFVFLPGQARPK